MAVPEQLPTTEPDHETVARGRVYFMDNIRALGKKASPIVVEPPKEHIDYYFDGPCTD